jgi:hypothetical protein
MHVRSKLERLERQLPPPPPPSPEDRRRQRRWARITRRFFDLVEQAAPLMNEVEQQQIGDALEACFEKLDGPLRPWVRNLQFGRCRLPELTPEVMKAVLFSWFHPDIENEMTCNHCGLAYPHLNPGPQSTWRRLPGKIPFESPPPWYDLPRVFDACPCCGASTYDMTWSHLTQEMDLPWKKLDGWMGHREERR